MLEVLSTPQVDNTIDDNIIRRKLRTIETIDKEYFPWVYVDNICTVIVSALFLMSLMYYGTVETIICNVFLVLLLIVECISLFKGQK